MKQLKSAPFIMKKKILNSNCIKKHSMLNIIYSLTDRIPILLGMLAILLSAFGSPNTTFCH